MWRQYHSTPRDCLCSASLSFEWRRECILTSTFLSKENAIRKWSGTARTLDALMGINDAVALIGPAINCNGDRNFRKRSLSLGSYKPRYRGRVQCAWDLFTGTVLFNQLLGNSWSLHFSVQHWHENYSYTQTSEWNTLFRKCNRPLHKTSSTLWSKDINLKILLRWNVESTYSMDSHTRFFPSVIFPTFHFATKWIRHPRQWSAYS